MTPSKGSVEDSTSSPLNSTLNPNSNTTTIIESTDDEFYTQSHHRQITSNVVITSSGTNNNVARTSYNVNNHINFHAIGSSGTNNINVGTSCNNVNNDMDLHAIMSSSWINNNVASTSNNNNVDDDMDFTWNSGYPAGFRFCPLDGELIYYYLRRKISKMSLPHARMKDVVLYGTTPEKLCAENEPVGDNEWYFFTPRERKYPKGERPSRSAGTGYWKATGADKDIYHPHDEKKLIGLKKTLVFYDGKAPKGVKTNWIMHEYKMLNTPSRKRLHESDMTLDDWVLCRIYNKIDRPPRGNTKVKTENEDNPNPTVHQTPTSLAQPEMVQEDAKLHPQNLTTTFNNPYLPEGGESLIEDNLGLFRNDYNKDTLESIINYVPPILPHSYIGSPQWMDLYDILLMSTDMISPILRRNVFDPPWILILNLQQRTNSWEQQRRRLRLWRDIQCPNHQMSR
ncbi:hypothetical protein Leryth_003410 [Lithospermum erythrorhizon]|nr:hypothetical protein Leryth_003410 [Lithospermum erythrorhizon]